MSNSSPPPVALLSDFGSVDHYAGVMKGVIAGIAPHAPILDISHEIPAFDVPAAAFVLLASYRYFPPGTIFCCVVDPGVGTSREALAVELSGTSGTRFVVCPDNGLLSHLREMVTSAVSLDRPRYHLEPSGTAGVSSTFHGRDIFAPAAAHLANGVQLGDLGSARDHKALVTLAGPELEREGRGWKGSVIHIDHFGNLITNLPAKELVRSPAWRLTVADRTILGLSTTFAQVPAGGALAYLGSSGYLELAVREGNAASEWGVSVGDITRAEPVD